jgi:hypothetical protein
VSKQTKFETEIERARTSSNDGLTELVYHNAPEVLLALLENPAIAEQNVCLLLARKDLPVEVLEEVGARKSLLKSYAVKKSLMFHPRTPRLIGLRLLRDLYLMDLVQFTLSTSVSVELKRQAEAQIIGRIPQLPLGQKVALARRASGHVAGSLVADGHPGVLRVVLDNPFLSEANVLKALAREKVPAAVIKALCGHSKWSQIYNVRLALVRNPSAPLATILAFLPHLTVNDLRELASPGIVPENLRNYLQAEVQRRMRASQAHSPLKS